MMMLVDEHTLTPMDYKYGRLTWYKVPNTCINVLRLWLAFSLYIPYIIYEIRETMR